MNEWWDKKNVTDWNVQERLDVLKKSLEESAEGCESVIVRFYCVIQEFS